MPTLPLYAPPHARPAGASPDAGHGVTAPGGYEWWHFEAADAAGHVRLVATLYDGFPFHPAYLRAHARYLRRPTRVAPAGPALFPCVSFAVYEDGRPASRFLTQYPPGSFRASDERPEVRVGPNVLQRGAEGTLRLAVTDTPGRATREGSTRPETTSPAATLSFRPLLPCPPLERRFLSHELTGADHYWVLANPLCDVEGTVRVPCPGAPGGERAIAFRGRGYHDHHYGTGPIGPGLRRWIRGHAVFTDQARTFHLAHPRDARRRAERHLIVSDSSAVRDLTVCRADTGREVRAGWGLSYPATIELCGERPDEGLRLTNGRVIDGTPFSVRLTYDATDGRHLTGRAFCEIMYPRRLRWPALGRLIERSIRIDDSAR